MWVLLHTAYMVGVSQIVAESLGQGPTEKHMKPVYARLMQISSSKTCFSVITLRSIYRARILISPFFRSVVTDSMQAGKPDTSQMTEPRKKKKPSL
jgi:hypothetical protein